jgi:hypothetical protein
MGLTASIDVNVDGETVLATGGKFRMSDVDLARFNDAGGTHFVELKWRVVPQIPVGIHRYVQPLDYQLRIDGALLGESTVEFNYMPAMLLLTLAVGGILMFWLQHEIGTTFAAASKSLGSGKKF